MDRFADGMIARGPTLAPDRATWTGSLHILDLPTVDAACEFVEHEPYNLAGLFDQHLIRIFNNRLARTMWEFPGPDDEPRFLVIAERYGPITTPPLEHLIVYGELLTPQAAQPAGFAMALQAPTRAAVDRLVQGVGVVQIYDWEFGGRR